MSGKLQECQMSEPLPELIPAKAATSPGIPATAPDKHRQVAAFTPEGWPPSPDSVAAFVRIGWPPCSGIRNYGWFVGFFAAGALYVGLQRRAATP